MSQVQGLHANNYVFGDKQMRFWATSGSLRLLFTFTFKSSRLLIFPLSGACIHRSDGDPNIKIVNQLL